MDKGQAIHRFWSGFGIPAFDETDVPEMLDGIPVTMPYITYNVSTDSLDNVVFLTASLWYKSSSWEQISKKTEQIAEAIVKMDPPSIAIDNGRLYLAKGTPFAQRMSEPNDDTIRRMYLMVQAEFLTAF